MELGKTQVRKITACIAFAGSVVVALGQTATPATITGLRYVDTNGVAHVWTNTPTNATILPPLPTQSPQSLPVQVWRVTCPYCNTTFNTGAVFDRVVGGTSVADGSTIESHQMRCNCSNCSKDIYWYRSVSIPKVIAVPVNPP